MNTPITLRSLASALLAAKSAEDRARAERLRIEDAIVAMLPEKEEGTISEKLDGIKITVTHKLTRKADTIALRAHWTEISQPVQSCFRWLAEVSLTELRRLSPEAAAEASKYLTTSPAKPSVKIEEVK